MRAGPKRRTTRRRTVLLGPPARLRLGQITNASTVDFSINATKTIYGLFICGGTGAGTKGGTTGTLWSTGAFGTAGCLQQR